MRSVGVEEELLLVNAESGVPLTVATQAIARAETEDGETIDHELQQQQIETDTAPTTEMSVLADEIDSWRRTAIDGARRAGARVVASGTPVLRAERRVDEDPRYQRMVKHFGLTATEQLTCACHVHVSVESRDEGVAVLDRIRGWTPILTAMSANSPFWHGTDTGYASFRSQALQRWPSAGPQSIFGSAAEYDELIESMLRTGVILDEAMVYFDSRLSAHYPTVEIRVADVCSDARDTVLIAALCRAIVDMAAQQWQDDVSPNPVSPTLVRLATWKSGRFGLEGDLLDPQTFEPRPAREVVDGLVELVEPSLTASGDIDFVRDEIDRLFENGTGATRQRRVLEKTGSLSDVSAYVARVTAGQDD